MIDYGAFHNYLVESVARYQRTRSTRGLSLLARDYHCAAITQAQFKDFGLTSMKANEVTEEFSRWVRDKIGRSDAKQTLRETIGPLNEGILSGSRISQGSDRTVQITITQPMQQVAVTQQQTQQPAQQPQQQARQGFTGGLPLYRPGQIVYRKGGMMHLVSRLVDQDRFTWEYELYLGEDGHEYINRNTGSSSWMGNADLRPAKGNEVARFLGALTRSGIEWTADNANGLFFVKQKQPRQQKPVEVFANDLPNGYHGIYALPAYSPSPYRFALCCVSCVDNAQQFMAESQQPPVVENAILRQLEAINQGQGCDGIREYLEYDLPTLCCTDDVREHRVAFVKVNNNGTSYWLSRDRDVLRLLAWVAYII